MPMVKLNLNVDEVIEDIAGHVDSAAIIKTWDMQPGELSEGTSYRHMSESGSDKKDDVVPRKWCQQKHHIKGTARYIS